MTVLERAIEVIGDRPSAIRWMFTPLPALDGKMPIEVDEAAVRSALDALESGSW